MSRPSKQGTCLVVEGTTPLNYTGKALFTSRSMAGLWQDLPLPVDIKYVQFCYISPKLHTLIFAQRYPQITKSSSRRHATEYLEPHRERKWWSPR